MSSMWKAVRLMVVPPARLTSATDFPRFVRSSMVGNKQGDGFWRAWSCWHAASSWRSSRRASGWPIHGRTKVARVVATAEATIGAIGSDGTGGNFGTIGIAIAMSGGATQEATFRPTTLSLASHRAICRRRVNTACGTRISRPATNPRRSAGELSYCRSSHWGLPVGAVSPDAR
jgi:hypothetical protein